MTDIATANTPVKRLPTHFERVELRGPDTWRGHLQMPGFALIGESFWDPASSSSCPGAIENIPLTWPKSPTATASSRTGLEDTRQHLSHGLSRPDELRSAAAAAPWFGEFQPMLMHAGADGTEVIEPLPDEPEPVSHERPIRHG